ncbi:MAG: hypothetical protein GF375_06000 [Candidatus Omnitrophica bacterium]|nr:hypothetical protein [Candidatus Omnitrophota bacterium]MBD3269528.1 hypothetical protein [Candidatus Omnitrophota bacterium]
MSNNSQYHEDEIDLGSYIKVLIKRKATIIVIFTICVISAALYNFLAPNVYKVEETVRIGSIGGYLISKEEAMKEIRSRDVLEPVIKQTGEHFTISELKRKLDVEEIENTPFLLVSIKHTDPDLAIAVLEGIAKNFIGKGNELYQQRISLLEEQIKDLEERKVSVEKGINDLQYRLNSNIASTDYPLMQDTLSSYERFYSNLASQLYSEKLRLLDSKRFELFEPPIKPEKPVEPKKKQNIVIGAILGLMLGVFAAFFKEFWARSMSQG